jgi:hypothetical protein
VQKLAVFIIVTLLYTLVISFLIKFSWDMSVASYFDLKELSYLQAFQLRLLSLVLLGNFELNGSLK